MNDFYLQDRIDKLRAELDAAKRDEGRAEKLLVDASFYLSRRGAGQDANALAAQIDEFLLGVRCE